MAGKLLQINLFGMCTVCSIAADGFVISGSKHKALFALLVTAPFGRRTRAFLQETLWGTTCYDTGRQSLRRALADIKQIMGPYFEQVFSVNNLEITLDLSCVHFQGHTQAAPFLEGLDIREAGFQKWLASIRQAPGQLAGLFSLVNHAPAHSVLPSIAIIPFRSIGDEQDGILGDWLAEEICRSLSRSRLISVISHLSSRQLVWQGVDVAAIRASLGADFFVAGTVRRASKTVVLDVDLIDTRSGRIILTRQFTETIEHFLEQTTDAIGAIVAAIGDALADDALVHVRGSPLAEIDDHRLLIAGVNLMHRSTLRDFARSRELIEEALRRAPHAPETHAWLGKWYVLSVFNGWSSDSLHERQKALDSVSRGLDLSPDNAFCLTIDGFAQNNLHRNLQVAEARYTAALRSNPNSALSWLLIGVLHAFQDRGEEADVATSKALRLSPLDPFGYFYDTLIATTCLATGDFERALKLADRSLLVNNRHLSTYRAKIVALCNLDRIEDARVVGTEMMRRQPDFTVSGYLHSHPSADFRFGANAAKALRAAGIP